MASPRRTVVRILAALLLAAAPACRCGAGGESGGASEGGSASAGESGSASAGESAGESGSAGEGEGGSAGEEGVGDGGNRFGEAGPKVERDLDGPPDPACTGNEIAFAAAVVDPRCAIGSARAKKLRALLERDGGPVAGLRQEAKVGADGRVALRLVNKSGTSLTLPLSFHAKLPAFSVLAEDERHTLYELESPPLELSDPAQGNRSHFARIVLPPGGAAVATLTISPSIARVLGRGAGDTCKDAGAAASADGGPCSATKLAKGHYVVHVGELLTDVEAGPPARATVDLP